MIQMLAGEFQLRFQSGLQICGQDENGEIEWMGDMDAWKATIEESPYGDRGWDINPVEK